MLQMEKTDVKRSFTKQRKMVPTKPASKLGKGDCKKKKLIKKADSVNPTPKASEPHTSTAFSDCLTTSTPRKNNSVYSEPSQDVIGVGVMGPSDREEQAKWAAPAPFHLPCAHLLPVYSNQHVVEDPESQHPVPLTEFSRVNEEVKMDSMDPTPAIDSMCQTTFEKQVPDCKVKNMSRHEAAKKVMTVKNLLRELKAIVADQVDCVALISEVERSISMLPAMVGNTSIQAEIAEAVRPLKNENAQLRRRLRILNQQLMERERVEKEAQSVDSKLEMHSFHTVNKSLQSQLREMKQEVKALQKENQELQKSNRQLLQLAEDRDGEVQQIRQHDVDDAISAIKSGLPTLDVSESDENPCLSFGIQKKEAVINKLHQVTRDLPRVLPEPPLEKNGPESSFARTNKLDLYGHQEKEACLSNPIYDTVNTFLNSTRANANFSAPGAIYCSVGNAPHLGWSTNEAPRLTEDIVCSPKHQAILSTAEKDVGFSLDRDPQGEFVYVPLKEVQSSGDVRRISPFGSMNHVMSPECSNKIQGAHCETKVVAESFERLHISEQELAYMPVFDLTENFLANADITSKSIGKNIPPNATLSCEGNKMGGKPLMFDATFSSCEIKSVASNWSASSWSSFNTLDEQDFRNGLAALDASIASLQRTIQSDLNR